jgi:hypothetical protein
MNLYKIRITKDDFYKYTQKYNMKMNNIPHLIVFSYE